MDTNFSDAQKKFDDLSKPSGDLNNSLFDGILGDFFEFFGNLVVGEKSNTQDKDNRCAGAIASANTIDMAQRSIIDIFNENTQEIDQEVNTFQEITINCGDKKLDGMYLEKQYEYDIFGNKKEPGCIKYGCCYDINQIATNNIESVNSSILNESSRMFNTIKSSLKSDVNIEVGEQCNIGVLDQAISQSESDSIENINQILTESISTTANLDQNIIVESHTPLRCMNDCDEPPSAGTIKQSINVDIHSQNIVNTTLDSIVKNYKDISSDTKFSVSAIPKVKLYIFSIMSIILMIFIYSIIFVGFKYLLEKIPEVGPRIKLFADENPTIYGFIILFFPIAIPVYPIIATSICAKRTNMKDLTCYLD